MEESGVYYQRPGKAYLHMFCMQAQLELLVGQVWHPDPQHPAALAYEQSDITGTMVSPDCTLQEGQKKIWSTSVWFGQSADDVAQCSFGKRGVKISSKKFSTRTKLISLF